MTTNNPGEAEMVVAIPADGYWSARFTHKNGHRMIFRMVVAWDDSGHALVVHAQEGRLMRAVDDPSFGRLVRRKALIGEDAKNEDAKDLELTEPIGGGTE